MRGIAAFHATAWLVALTTASAPAQTSFGVGSVLCSQYLRAARSSDILYHQASNWLLGYVSGMNAALQATRGSVPPINLTNDQVLKSAADYCEANLNSTIAGVANQWYAGLPRQSEAQAPARSEPRDSNSIRLNLEAPKRKPLLDRQ